MTDNTQPAGTTPVVKLAEAAQILGVSIRAAETALRRAEISSGYPRDAVEQLAATHARRTPRSTPS
jgi:hypothetical protein